MSLLCFSSKTKLYPTYKLFYATTTEQIASRVEALTENSWIIGGGEEQHCTLIKKRQKMEDSRTEIPHGPKELIKNTKSIAQLLMEATMRYQTRPVHRLTFDHCCKPVLMLCISYQILTFKVCLPPSSTSVQSFLCLVTVAEQIAEKRSCGEDIFIHIQPCQFQQPWQIFKTKAHYTFSIRTRVVWWTVQNKLLLSKKKIDINIL